MPTPDTGWFHQPVPPEWQWITVALTIVALVLALMALPTVFQMLWGGPQLSLAFDNEERGAIRFLVCRIINPPIRNRVLRTLGVKRTTAEDVIVDYTVREKGTNRVVHATVRASLFAFDEEAGVRRRMSLPPSFLPARVPLIAGQKSNGSVTLFARDLPSEEVLLSPGYYELDVHAFSGELHRTATRGFRVGTRSEDLYWT